MSITTIDDVFGAWLGRKPELMRAGYEAGRHAAPLLADAKGIVLAGMGGSGSAGRMVRDAVHDVMPVPLHVVHDYRLPGDVGEGWVVLALSYSGDTEETLAVAEAAARRGATIVAFTTGGRLAGLAQHTIRQPKGFKPRAALGHMWMSVLGALEAAGLIDLRVPLDEAIEAVRQVDAVCGVKAPIADNPARELADRMSSRVPCIYGTPRLAGVAHFMSAMINENAKRLSFYQLVPESNHNDLVGWSADPLRDNMIAVAFNEARDDDELSRRLAYMRGRYQEWGVPWYEPPVDPIVTAAECVVQQARCIQFAEYTSLYLAAAEGVDPAEIAAVDGLKQVLRTTGPLATTSSL